MGANYSAEADAEVDACANWTAEQPCPCPKIHFFTTSLTWETVPFIGERCCSKQELPHDAVQATFQCTACGHEFSQTYDLSHYDGTSTKRKRWGYYGKHIQVKRHSAEHFPFAHLERCYERTSETCLLPTYQQNFFGRYGAGTHRRTNDDWPRDFFRTVTATAEEPKSKCCRCCTIM